MPTLPPMMRPAEVDHLLSVVAALPDNAHILEFGSGGSTVLLASRLKPTQHLYSVEHNPQWYTDVTAAIDGQPNVHVCLREPDLTMQCNIIFSPGVTIPDGAATLTTSRYTAEECPAGYNAYLNGNYGQDWSRVGLVVVDGMCRAMCLALLRSALTPGTTVLLHDMDACDGEDSRYRWYGAGASLYHHEATVNSMWCLRRL